MTATIDLASPEQLDLAAIYWAERTDIEFPREKFAGYLKVDVSALITRMSSRPALPATEEQLDTIAGLRAALDWEPRPVENRTHANKLILKMRDIERRLAYKRRLEAADVELDALLAGEDGAVVPF